LKRRSQFNGHKLTSEKIVTGNYLKKVVGGDGIEPPTPGFSVLFPNPRKYTEVFDTEQHVTAGSGAGGRWNDQEWA
jgi:hypothetical protein